MEQEIALAVNQGDRDVGEFPQQPLHPHGTVDRRKAATQVHDRTGFVRGHRATPTPGGIGDKGDQQAVEDSLYRLKDWIELDDALLGGKRSGKRGRGAEGKTPVMVACETRGERAGLLAREVIRLVAGLPWVHIAIANLKRFLLGTFHGSRLSIYRNTSMNSAITQDSSRKGAADNWADRAICTGIIGVRIKHAIEQINLCRSREGDALAHTSTPTFVSLA